MNDTFFKLSDNVVYRKVNDELVLIEVESGSFFHFTGESDKFFDFFQQPASVSDYCASLEEGNRKDEEKKLSDFVSQMLDKKVIAKAEGRVEKTRVPTSFVRPQFIRQGERRLEEVSFLY